MPKNVKLYSASKIDSLEHSFGFVSVSGTPKITWTPKLGSLLGFITVEGYIIGFARQKDSNGVWRNSKTGFS